MTDIDISTGFVGTPAKARETGSTMFQFSPPTDPQNGFEKIGVVETQKNMWNTELLSPPKGFEIYQAMVDKRYPENFYVVVGINPERDDMNYLKDKKTYGKYIPWGGEIFLVTSEDGKRIVVVNKLV